MRIVVATDLTDASTDAARYGVGRAEKLGADLVVAHVVGSAGIDTREVVASRYKMSRHSNDPDSLVDEFTATKIGELRDWFTNAVGIPETIDVSFAIDFGDLPTVIWKIVDETGADSLVVGSHGTHSVGRHLSRILLAATIPVVVVRQGVLGSATS